MDEAASIVGNYIIGNQIGAGSFSRVNLAVEKSSGMHLCVKIISKKRIENPKDMQHTKDEISVLSSLSHPNIVRYYRMLMDDNNIYIFMEYCKGKSLLSLINEKGPMPDECCKKIFYQLLETLDFLHQNKIAHRDIKPDNIMVDANMGIKLIDFGLCSSLSGEDNLLNTFCGSVLYSAPECIRRDSYIGSSADMWSAGVTLYAMTAGKLPWSQNNATRQMISQLAMGPIVPPPNASMGCADLIIQLLQFYPNQRPSAKQALTHYWFEEFHVNGLKIAANAQKPTFFKMSFVDKVPYSKHGVVSVRSNIKPAKKYRVKVSKPKSTYVNTEKQRKTD